MCNTNPFAIIIAADAKKGHDDTLISKNSPVQFSGAKYKTSTPESGHKVSCFSWNKSHLLNVVTPFLMMVSLYHIGGMRTQHLHRRNSF